VDVDAVAAAAGERERVRRAWGMREDEVAVALFGRVVPWKGQLQFARAMAKAMQADPRIRAVLVGDGGDGGAAHLEAVRAEVRASGLEARWTFAGYRADVEACYAAADVVVHASITPEPFGMVVPEAMAAGRPVIAADAGGPAEVVEHGVHGLRVPPGDVDALADAVLALAGDPALRAAMGELGRAHARTRFRVEHGARAVAGVYARVLGRAAAGTEPAPAEAPAVAGARG
jgi:glycosyltransferase involved in cell wall biosynthesis